VLEHCATTRTLSIPRKTTSGSAEFVPTTYHTQITFRKTCTRETEIEKQYLWFCVAISQIQLKKVLMLSPDMLVLLELGARLIG